jgi:hypothetical protein
MRYDSNRRSGRAAICTGMNNTSSAKPSNVSFNMNNISNSCSNKSMNIINSRTYRKSRDRVVIKYDKRSPSRKDNRRKFVSRRRYVSM